MQNVSLHQALRRAAGGEEVLPVRWENNDFALLPGETRTVTMRYDAVADAGPLTLRVSGWNNETHTLLAPPRLRCGDPGDDPRCG
jgi:hypothetical protein